MLLTSVRFSPFPLRDAREGAVGVSPLVVTSALDDREDFSWGAGLGELTELKAPDLDDLAAGVSPLVITSLRDDREDFSVEGVASARDDRDDFSVLADTSDLDEREDFSALSFVSATSFSLLKWEILCFFTGIVGYSSACVWNDNLKKDFSV